MRVPLSWLREYVDLPATETGRDVQAKLVSAGLEVETVEQLGADLKGPLVVGQVLTIEELEGFKKPIRFCTVDVGRPTAPASRRRSSAAPGTSPSATRSSWSCPAPCCPATSRSPRARRTARLSHGMICSGDELGMGDDGSAASSCCRPSTRSAPTPIELLELVDEVLDIAVTPDRGYCLSMRGVAREAATAYGLPLRDPALLDVPGPNAFGYPVQVSDPRGCDRFTARTVTGLRPRGALPDLAAAPPAEGGHAPDLARRRHHQLRDAGARPAAARLRPLPRPGHRSACAGPSRARSSPPSTAPSARWTPRTW